MIATVMQVLDMTIANVALPHMQAALGASQESVSWVLTSYIIASAVAIPITGWLSDRIGLRTLYLWSVGGFVAASILCGLAANIESMVLFRLLQGISGAFLSPLAQTVLLDNTQPEKRGQAMALFGMGVMLGPIAGPLLGGALTESLNWRWIFFVNVPIGVVAFAGLWLRLPELKRPARSFDLLGFATLALGLASLQLMLDRGPHLDWFSSAEIWFELAIAVSALWVFAIHIMTSRNPLYSRQMLTNRDLVVAVALMGVVGFVLTASMALLPVMMQGLLGYPVIDAGLLLAMRGIGVMISMAVSGQLVQRIDPRLTVATAFAMIALSFGEMSYWSLDVDWWTMAMNGFLQGLGIGLVFVPISTMAYVSLAQRFRTDAAGLLNLTRSIGSSIGISVVMMMLTHNSAVSHADLASHITPFRLWLDPALLALQAQMTEAGAALIDMEINRQAAMIGFLDDFHMMMVIVTCMIPLCLFIRRSEPTSGNQQASIADIGH